MRKLSILFIFLLMLPCISLLDIAQVAMAGPINLISPTTLKGGNLITFDDIHGGIKPGINYDYIIQSDGVDFGERFVGQTLTHDGGFDVLSDSIIGHPLARTYSDIPGHNLVVVEETHGGITSQYLAGLGPQGYPNDDGAGEGSISISSYFDK